MSCHVKAVPAERINRKQMNYVLNITTCDAPPTVAATAAAAGYIHFSNLV